MEKQKISLVIPVYNEEKQIAESLKVIKEILDQTKIAYEFILIDDGSRDNTWKVLKELPDKMPQLKALRLSRNFGKEAALCAGLEAVTGDACIVMDADLQHPPDIIPEMIRLWRDEGYDVIEGVKAFRGKENLINRLGAIWFYKLLNKLSRFDLNSASDFKLMDEKVINAWKQLGERNTFFRGMSLWVGFNRVNIPFIVANRTTGQSKWSFLRLFRLAVTAITSFSSVPLQFVTMLGFAFLAGSFLLGVQTLYMKFKGIAVSGFTTVILLQLIIGSALMISLGIIGTYIARIFDEVKSRPRYLISERIDKNK